MIKLSIRVLTGMKNALLHDLDYEITEEDRVRKEKEIFALTQGILALKQIKTIQ